MVITIHHSGGENLCHLVNVVEFNYVDENKTSRSVVIFSIQKYDIKSGMLKTEDVDYDKDSISEIEINIKRSNEDYLVTRLNEIFPADKILIQKTK